MADFIIKTVTRCDGMGKLFGLGTSFEIYYDEEPMEEDGPGGRQVEIVNWECRVR